MIYAVIMSGGKGTRLKADVEKPLFKLRDKPLIDYVIKNLSDSKFIDKIFVAVSPNTPVTTKYLSSLDSSFEIIDTPGTDYLNDLSFILDFFEKKSKDDTLLVINADLPFISSDLIDYVIGHYLSLNVESLSTLVPVEIFKELNLLYSYDFDGLVPSGLNILKTRNVIQEEENLILSKVELAININTLQDASIANSLFNSFF